MPDPSDFARQLALLRQSFVAELPARMAAMAAEVEALRAGRAEAVAELHHLAHNMAGTAGSFGYPELGAQSRALETHLKPWAAAGRRPDPERLDEALWLFDLLRAMAAAVSVPDGGAAEDLAEACGATAGRRVHLVSQDDRDAALADQLRHFGFAVTCCPDEMTARREAHAQGPDAWLIDVDLAGSPGAGIALGQSLGAAGTAPLLFLSSRDDLDDRLAAARAGGVAYFVQPLDAMQLVDRLDGLLGCRADEPYRILVVDDDRLLAERSAMVLGAASMQAEWAQNAPAALRKLEELRPDLVLMDLHMPGCSGMELARVIRQYDAHVGLPIVYLSSEADLDSQFAAMAAGGDDFLTKPISDRHLVLAVRARAARARQIRLLTDTDSLTGLLKHGRIKERLSAELARSARTGRPLAFAMLDIDHFKRINDGHGHAIGDRVIKSLAMLLKQRLRQSDHIGRWGGEEFAVVLTECDPEQARDMLDGLRGRFADLRFSGPGGEFSVTLSAGVASSQGHGDPSGLVNAADAALYRAKTGGRDRVVVDGDAPA
ncbi:MAG: diguanylate cyclase [Thiobacillaceae bacterium]|jgi:diguanylate cyclase (GGDEF)-like protein|nr:diguanylate cyclase [Thiobacillaceae bacterium]